MRHRDMRTPVYKGGTREKGEGKYEASEARETRICEW